MLCFILYTTGKDGDRTFDLMKECIGQVVRKCGIDSVKYCVVSSNYGEPLQHVRFDKKFATEEELVRKIAAIKRQSNRLTRLDNDLHEAFEAFPLPKESKRVCADDFSNYKMYVWLKGARSTFIPVWNISFTLLSLYLTMARNTEQSETPIKLCPWTVGIWKCWLLRRGENRSTRRKTPRSKDENQQQTQPTFDSEFGNRTRATLVGGKMHNHCAIPAPQASRHPRLMNAFV